MSKRTPAATPAQVYDQAEKPEPICGKCGLVLTPRTARLRPELFLHDECLPDELKPIDRPVGNPAELLEPRPTAIVTTEPDAAGWLGVINKIVDKGGDKELLTTLFQMQKEWRAEQQRMEAVEDFAKFKAEAPRAIQRTGHVGFQAGGKQVGYDHVELDYACSVLVPLMSKYGFTHSWDTVQDETGITVRCRLEHVGGHVRSVTLRGQPDTSGSKNPIQAVGSTVSYLQRYTFLSVLGMAQGGDTDAGGQGGTVSDGQLAEIMKLVDEMSNLGATPGTKWIQWAANDDTAIDWKDVPASRYEHVVTQLQAKIKAKKEQKPV